MAASGSAEEWVAPENLEWVVAAEAFKEEFNWEHGEYVGEPVQEDESVDVATRKFADLLIEQYNSGLPATTVCKLCYWASRGGMGGVVAEMAKRPGLKSGVYNKHLSKLLGYDDRGETFELLDIPCTAVVKVLARVISFQSYLHMIY